jgi:hypothetical protein
MNLQIKFILWPIYSREKDAIRKFAIHYMQLCLPEQLICQSTFLLSFLASFPDESFDKTFHVSVSIDGITADRKPVMVLHSDRAHNRYKSCLLVCAIDRFLFCNSHFLQGRLSSF